MLIRITSKNLKRILKRIKFKNESWNGLEKYAAKTTFDGKERAHFDIPIYPYKYFHVWWP